MTVRLLQTAALSLALVAAPAFATSHKHAKHHATRKHARTAAHTGRARHAQLAKADPAPAAAATPATDESGEPMPAGGRRVVAHSIYASSSDRTE